MVTRYTPHLRISDRDGLRLVCALEDWRLLTDRTLQTDWRAEATRTHATPAPAR